jgi:hypothetical protein
MLPLKSDFTISVVYIYFFIFRLRSVFKTCMQSENNICEMAFNINITNCGGYYVYYMVKTPTNSSYCVGKFPLKYYIVCKVHMGYVHSQIYLCIYK